MNTCQKADRHLNASLLEVRNAVQSPSPTKYCGSLQTRTLTLKVAGIELLAILSRIVRLFCLTTLQVVRACTFVSTLLFFRSFKALNRLDAKLPGPKDVYQTTYRIVQLFVGLCFTSSIGVLFSPKLNVDLHQALKLVTIPKSKPIPEPPFQSSHDPLINSSLELTNIDPSSEQDSEQQTSTTQLPTDSNNDPLPVTSPTNPKKSDQGQKLVVSDQLESDQSDLEDLSIKRPASPSPSFFPPVKSPYVSPKKTPSELLKHLKFLLNNQTLTSPKTSSSNSRISPGASPKAPSTPSKLFPKAPSTPNKVSEELLELFRKKTPTRQTESNETTEQETPQPNIGESLPRRLLPEEFSADSSSISSNTENEAVFEDLEELEELCQEITNIQRRVIREIALAPCSNNTNSEKKIDPAHTTSSPIFNMQQSMVSSEDTSASLEPQSGANSPPKRSRGRLFHEPVNSPLTNPGFELSRTDSPAAYQQPIASKKSKKPKTLLTVPQHTVMMEMRDWNSASGKFSENEALDSKSVGLSANSLKNSSKTHKTQNSKNKVSGLRSIFKKKN